MQLYQNSPRNFLSQCRHAVVSLFSVSPCLREDLMPSRDASAIRNGCF